MKVVAFLCLVILGGFVLVGRMSGDIENLREQKRTLESALQAAQDALDKSQFKVAELTQLLDKVQSERDQAADTIQVLRQTISSTLQERDQALSTAEELRLALAAAQQDRDRAFSAIQQLNLTVLAAHHARDQALAHADGLEKRVQELAQVLEIVQAAAQSHVPNPGNILQKGDLAPMFTLVVVMVMLGYSGIRRVHRSARKPQKLLPASTGCPSNTEVWVCMPRAWTADYARWARHMQSTAQDHKASE